MLQVIVRAFDGARWSEIETIDIVNKGHAEGWDKEYKYTVRRYMPSQIETDVIHDRADGALVLVRKALERLER